MNQMRAVFELKPEMRPERVKVEKTVRLPEADYEKFLEKPMRKYEFLEENAEMMRRDSDGVCHCILVTADGRRDGILVNSEGASYARYASYVPDAAAVAYDAFSELGMRLSCLIDRIMDGEIAGKDCVSFEDIRKISGLDPGKNPFLQELVAGMIAQRQEVVCVGIDDNGFHLQFCQEHLREIQGEKTQEVTEAEKPAVAEYPAGTLGELLALHRENLRLIHEDLEYLPQRIEEAGLDVLTEAGKEAWADVLHAKVRHVYRGHWELMLECGDVNEERLSQFSDLLCGYCRSEDYEKWVKEEPETSHGQTMAGM